MQLQRRVFQLEGSAPAAAASYTTCYIETPFNGTHYATEPTLTAARAKAMEKCSASGASSIHCGENDVKCGK